MMLTSDSLAPHSMPKTNPEEARRAARKAYNERHKIVRVIIPNADVPMVESAVGGPLNGPNLTEWVLRKIKESHNADRN